MPRRTPFALALLCLVSSLATAEEAKEGELIDWSKDLPAALAKGKEAKRIVMVCVNAKYVEGRKEEEPAAKGLRETIYKDKRVVTRSREFVCVMLTRAGSSAEFGELRALGIDGHIISPQHIFIAPEGDRILHRKEYWPYGSGESGVKALLDMMTKAETELTGKAAAPEAPPEEPEQPQPEADAPQPEAAPATDERAEWIARMLRQVTEGSAAKREAALDSLIANDKDGDCIKPLVALIPENKKDAALLVDLIRALGRDGLHLAAPAIADQLGHKDERVRGNAAVSLEYIGCKEKKIVSALRKLAGKEKIPEIANHAYRALGRCGAGDSKVRGLLVKKASGAKSEFASYGPSIGLAYFEKDKKAARAVEKLLKKIGVPGSRRGGGGNALKRSLLSWTLASIGDPKSGTFVREELMAGLKHVQAPWVGGLMSFWDTVARVCEGERDRLGDVENGVRGAVSYVKGIGLQRYGAEIRHLMDEYRLGREEAGFTPKGDHILNDER